MEAQQNKDFELPPVTSSAVRIETGQSHEEAAESVRLEQGQSIQQTPLSGAVSVQQVSYSDDVALVGSSAAGLASVSSGVSLPAVADDLDLIEKEWVEKAKQVVRVTLGDPYNQNKELSKIKADYIKKRYNKDIKTID